jgi:hypothetical protein
MMIRVDGQTGTSAAHIMDAWPQQELQNDYTPLTKPSRQIEIIVISHGFCSISTGLHV